MDRKQGVRKILSWNLDSISIYFIVIKKLLGGRGAKFEQIQNIWLLGYQAWKSPTFLSSSWIQRFWYSVLPSHKPVCDYFWLTKKDDPTLQPVRSSCNLYWPAICGCFVSYFQSLLVNPFWPAQRAGLQVYWYDLQTGMAGTVNLYELPSGAGQFCWRPLLASPLRTQREEGVLNPLLDDRQS